MVRALGVHRLVQSLGLQRLCLASASKDRLASGSLADIGDFRVTRLLLRAPLDCVRR